MQNRERGKKVVSAAQQRQPNKTRNSKAEGHSLKKVNSFLCATHPTLLTVSFSDKCLATCASFYCRRPFAGLIFNFASLDADAAPSSPETLAVCPPPTLEARAWLPPRSSSGSTLRDRYVPRVLPLLADCRYSVGFSAVNSAGALDAVFVILSGFESSLVTTLRRMLRRVTALLICLASLDLARPSSA